MNEFLNLNTPVELLNSDEGFDLYIKREDKSFCGFGTKIRKFKGILNFTGEKKQEVLLFGNPHSNFMVTFTILLHRQNIVTHAVHYTRDRNLRTINSILSKRFADTVYDSRTKENREYYIREFKYRYPEGFVVPEFGIHPGSLEGLRTLWEEIDSKDKFDYLFLDIGSGLTFISACNFYKGGRMRIVGISIGRPVNKMPEDLKQTSSRLCLEENIFNDTIILPPLTSPGYASTNSTLNQWIIQFWKEYAIPLEPVYSGKTLLTIMNYIKKHKLKGRGIYVHQGGLLNHYRYFLQEL